eukprot:TRINITY_DN17297_c0_g1_i1.p2 TRINITY_DN17297_c0_g1~~TRINITY_DN17297_c0_g1_i1.p2  ORF type:complete len:251 (+),score=94.04 TRINITY_DN17297_c0_g1_i1:130-882(+)
MAQTFESWWNGLGPVTKFTLITCLLLAGTVSFGLVDPNHLLFFPALLLVEPWRLFTATFFLGGFGMPFVFNLVFLVIYQQRLESEDYPLGFHGRTADHVWMMLVIVLALIPLALLLGLYFLSLSFSLAIVWVWCKRHEDQAVTFYGFSFKAGYFPWILMLIHVLMGSSPFGDLAGIVAGHVYVVFKDVMPDTHGYDLLKTPQFMYNIMPPQRVGVTSVAGAQTYMPDARGAAGPGAQAPHRWGAGRRLGD